MGSRRLVRRTPGRPERFASRLVRALIGWERYRSGFGRPRQRAGSGAGSTLDHALMTASIAGNSGGFGVRSPSAWPCGNQCAEALPGRHAYDKLPGRCLRDACTWPNYPRPERPRLDQREHPKSDNNRTFRFLS